MYRGETSAVLTERKCVGCGRCSSRRLLQSHLLCFPRHKDTRCTMMWVWAQEVVVLCSKRTHNSLKSPSSRFLPPQLRMHGRTSVLAVLPLPRHSKSAAADLAASHRALDTPILLIEAPGPMLPASAWALWPVFCAFQRGQPSGCQCGSRATGFDGWVFGGYRTLQQ